MSASPHPLRFLIALVSLGLGAHASAGPPSKRYVRRDAQPLSAIVGEGAPCKTKACRKSRADGAGQGRAGSGRTPKERTAP